MSSSASVNMRRYSISRSRIFSGVAFSMPPLLDAHVYDVGHIIRQRQITLRLHRQQDHRQQDGQRELLEALEDFFS